MISALSGMRWKGIAATGVAVVLLGMFNFHVSHSEIDLSPLATEVTPRPQPPAAPADEAASPEDVSLPETLVRPLFSPTRRDFVAEIAPAEPVEAPVEQPEVPLAEPPQLLLQGTRSIGGATSALVSLDGEETRWVSVGDEVQGWSVTAIYQDRLFIGQGEGARMINLYPGAED